MSLSAIWVSFYTIVNKEVTRFLRIWAQTLLPPIITQSLYFLIFGQFVGSQISDVDGIPYMQFIIPGLVMMAAINASFANVVTVIFGAKFQKFIEEILVSPTPNWVTLIGHSIGGVLRGLLVSILVFGVSFFFTRPTIDNIWLVLIFIIMSSTLFAFGGFLNGMLANKFDDVTIFQTFILTPLVYLGGIFYSIDRLPPFWRTVSMFNPIVYMVDGFRAGFYGQSDFPIGYSLLFVSIVTLILFGINWTLLNRGFGLRK